MQTLAQKGIGGVFQTHVYVLHRKLPQGKQQTYQLLSKYFTLQTLENMKFFLF